MKENPKIMSDGPSSPDKNETGFQAPPSHGRPRHRGPQHPGRPDIQTPESATAASEAPAAATGVQPPLESLPPSPPPLTAEAHQSIIAGDTHELAAVTGRLDAMTEQGDTPEQLAFSATAPSFPDEETAAPAADSSSTEAASTSKPPEPADTPTTSTGEQTSAAPEPSAAANSLLNEDERSFLADEIGRPEYTGQERYQLNQILQTGRYAGYEVTRVSQITGKLEIYVRKPDGTEGPLPLLVSPTTPSMDIPTARESSKPPTPTSTETAASADPDTTEQATLVSPTETFSDPPELSESAVSVIEEALASGNYTPREQAQLRLILANGQYPAGEVYDVSIRNGKLFIQYRKDGQEGGGYFGEGNVPLEAQAGGIALIPENLQGIQLERHVEGLIRGLERNPSLLSIEKIQQLMEELDKFPSNRLEIPAVAATLGALDAEGFKERLKDRINARLFTKLAWYSNQISQDADTLSRVLNEMDQEGVKTFRIAALGERDPRTGLERGEYAPQVREAIEFLEGARLEGGVYGNGAYYRLSQRAQIAEDQRLIGIPGRVGTPAVLGDLARSARDRIIDDYNARGVPPGSRLADVDLDNKAIEHARISLDMGKSIVNCYGQEAKYRGAVWENVALPGGGRGNRLAHEVAWEYAFSDTDPSLLKIRDKDDYSQRLRDYHNMIFLGRLGDQEQLAQLTERLRMRPTLLRPPLPALPRFQGGAVRRASSPQYTPADGVFGKVMFGPDQSALRPGGPNALSEQLALLALTRVESYATHKGFNSMGDLIARQTIEPRGATTFRGETVVAPLRPTTPPTFVPRGSLDYYEADAMQADGDMFPYAVQTLKAANDYVDLFGRSDPVFLSNPADASKFTDKPDEAIQAIQPFLKILGGTAFMQRVDGELYNETRVLYTSMYLRWLKGRWGSARSTEARDIFGIDNVKTIHVSRIMTGLKRYFRDADSSIARQVLDDFGREDMFGGLSTYIKLAGSGASRETKQGIAAFFKGIGELLRLDIWDS